MWDASQLNASARSKYCMPNTVSKLPSDSAYTALYACMKHAVDYSQYSQTECWNSEYAFNFNYRHHCRSFWFRSCRNLDIGPWCSFIECALYEVTSCSGSVFIQINDEGALEAFKKCKHSRLVAQICSNQSFSLLQTQRNLVLLFLVRSLDQ